MILRFLLSLASICLTPTVLLHAPPSPRGVEIDFGPAIRMQMVRAVARLEGFGVPGTLCTLRHNPGALRARSGRYLTFKTDAEGWDAATDLMDRRIAQGLTVGQIAERWAEAQDYGVKLSAITGFGVSERLCGTCSGLDK